MSWTGSELQSLEAKQLKTLLLMVLCERVTMWIRTDINEGARLGM